MEKREIDSMGKKNRRDGADSEGILDTEESADSRKSTDSMGSTIVAVPGSDREDADYGQHSEAGKSMTPGSTAELSGLTAAQVEERIAGGLTNRVDITTGKTTAQIVTSNLFTYFNLIFLILAVLLCLVESYRNLTFLPVIIGNTVIGIFQELRAKRTLDRMNMLNAPHAVAVRENVQTRIPSEELVQDDVVLLAAGDQICADARVLQGNISVNESLLTGEADEIRKGPGDALLSGSFVVAGQCYAKLEQVGEASYISKLTAQAKALGSGEQSEMVRSINQLVKWVGILIIPVGAVLFCQAYFVNGETIRTSIVSMIAAVIGMIPEGLYLLTTAALALSTIRLAGRKVLLHDMKSIEALARVDVLCVDKTGTITEPGMQVEKILPWRAGQGGTEQGSQQSGLPEGGLRREAGERESPEQKLQQLEWLLADYTAAIQDSNATMEAIREYLSGRSERRSRGQENPARTLLATLPFSSSRKYGAALFSDGEYVLGAPEFVLREDYALVSEEIAPYLKKGYRVLVLGKCEDSLTGQYPEDLAGEWDSEEENDPASAKAVSGKMTGMSYRAREISPGTLADELPEKVQPLGFIVLANSIRENAPETFSYFKEQGVQVKVISGDNPETVSEVARRAGIEGAEWFVDAGTLLSEEELEAASEKYTVFGRVTPKQKQLLVHALQKAGHTVAMTGDGVNDILAMKDADCSVAMASGSEAAAQASQVVLLDSDFAHMPDVVWEGRRVVNNIQRSASLFLVKNIFSLLLAMFSAVLAITYPLEPSQISLISMFTIGAPGFLLALEPNRNRIEGHFIRNLLLRAFPAGLTDVLAVGALVVCGQAFSLSKEDVATASTMLLAVVGFMILGKISVPFNRMKWGILGLNIFGLLFSGIFLGRLFAMSAMSEICILLMVVFAFAAESLFRYLSMATERLSRGGLRAKLKKIAESFLL